MDDVAAGARSRGCTNVRVFATLRMLAATCPHAMEADPPAGDAATESAPAKPSGWASVPGVEAVAPDVAVRLSSPVAAGLDGAARQHIPTQRRRPWGLDRVNQAELPLDGDSSTSDCYPKAGRGVHVFVVDSGCNARHEQFAHLGDRLRVMQAPGADISDGEDLNGHGTHVIGTIAGKDTGVAPGVRVTSVQVIGRSGRGLGSDIVAGIEVAAAWAAANPDTPTVLSASLGAPQESRRPHIFTIAVERAAAESGLLVITAAGNDRTDACRSSPGNSRGAINVANGNANDRLAYDSNYGTCVDVIAPGTRIVSADAFDTSGLTTKSGTSMAAPHVTGLAALILAERGKMTWQELLAALTPEPRVMVARYPLAWVDPTQC